MQCEEVREQFADYITDNFDGPVRDCVAEHLNTCQLCRLELQELNRLWTELGNLPQAEPVNNLREQFDRMLENHTQADHTSAKAWHRLIWLAAGAAALLVIGVAIGYHIRPAAIPVSELAELRSALYETRQMMALSLM